MEKNAGPGAVNIIQPANAKTEINNLQVGNYSFVLTVTDNKGLTANDTLLLTIVISGANREPIANGGPDQAVFLPTSELTLDGSGSTDPDNNIAGYLWTNISGPGPASIISTQFVKTQVTNLVEGIYQFEIEVTDSSGLSSKDTVQITITGECLITNTVLTSFGMLSEARSRMVKAAAGNKILFAGGETIGEISTRVDIYDIISNTWSTAELSIARYSMVAGTVGNKIFIAGGYIDQTELSSRVDIYDAATNTWSTAELSEKRALISSATAGDKIIFAGGYKFDGSSVVDIFNNATNEWTTANLSQSRWGLSATAVDNKIYLAGGEARGVGGPGPGMSDIVNTLDIYDVNTDSWSVSTLAAARGYMATIAVDGTIYFAGGVSSILPNSLSYKISDNAETRNTNENNSSSFQLCSPVAGTDAVGIKKNNTVSFFPGSGFPGAVPDNKFDIYDLSTNKWSTGLLQYNISGAAIISVNDIIYIAGGTVNGTLSNQVWTLAY